MPKGGINKKILKVTSTNKKKTVIKNDKVPDVKETKSATKKKSAKAKKSVKKDQRVVGKRKEIALKESVIDKSFNQDDFDIIDEVQGDAVVVGMQAQDKPLRQAQDKQVIMWTAVTFFMVVIFVLWSFNIKNVFTSVKAVDNENDKFDWQALSQEFSSALDEAKEEYDSAQAKLEEIKKINEDQLASSTPEVNNSSINKTTQDEIEDLKIKLKELEKDLEGSN